MSKKDRRTNYIKSLLDEHGYDKKKQSASDNNTADRREKIKSILDKNGYSEETARQLRKKLAADKIRLQGYTPKKTEAKKAETPSSAPKGNTDKAYDVIDRFTESLNESGTKTANKTEKSNGKERDKVQTKASSTADKKGENDKKNRYDMSQGVKKAKKEKAAFGWDDAFSNAKQIDSERMEQYEEEYLNELKETNPTLYYEEKEALEKRREAEKRASERMERENQAQEYAKDGQLGKAKYLLEHSYDASILAAEGTAKYMNDNIGNGVWEINRYASDREQFKEMYGVYPEEFKEKDLQNAADKLGVLGFIEYGKGGFNQLNDVPINVFTGGSTYTVINNGWGHNKKYRNLNDEQKEYVRLARLAVNNMARDKESNALKTGAENALNELTFGLRYNDTNYRNSVKNNRDEYSYVTMLDYKRAANDSSEFKKLYGVEPTHFTGEKLNELKNERGIGVGGKKINQSEYERLEMLANVIDNRLYNDPDYMNNLKNSNKYGYVSMIMGDMYSTPKNNLGRMNAEHPIAAAGGQLLGGTARTIGMGQIVGGLLPNASAPMTMGTTMAVDSGLRSLGGGDNPGQATVAAATSFIGGAAAGKAGEAAGNWISGKLAGKGLANLNEAGAKKITENVLKPELAKAGVRTVASASAMTLAGTGARKTADYVLDRDNFEISPQEILQDYVQNLVFCGFGEFGNALRANKAYKKAVGDEFMEGLGKHIASEYSDIVNSRDGATDAKKVGDIIEYTDRMLEHLENIEQGKPISVETNEGVKEYKIKLAGQKENIASLKDSLQQIKASARAYVDGNNGIIIDEGGNRYTPESNSNMSWQEGSFASPTEGRTNVESASTVPSESAADNVGEVNTAAETPVNAATENTARTVENTSENPMRRISDEYVSLDGIDGAENINDNMRTLKDAMIERYNRAAELAEKKSSEGLTSAEENELSVSSMTASIWARELDVRLTGEGETNPELHNKLEAIRKGAWDLRDGLIPQESAAPISNISNEPTAENIPGESEAIPERIPTESAGANGAAIQTEQRAGMVTENITKGMNAKTGAPTRADRIQRANNKIQQNGEAVFDRDFVKEYAVDFLTGMAQRNSEAYRALSHMDGYVGDELIKEVIDGSAAPEYKNNFYFQNTAAEFKNVLTDAVEKNAIMHERTYGGNTALKEQAAAVSQGDFSVLNINKYGFAEVADREKIPGLLQDELTNYLTEDEKTALDAIGTATGTPIKIVDSINDGTGDGCYLNGVIYISQYAGNKPMVVLSHEVTHSLEGTPSYEPYKNIVLDILSRRTGKYVTELTNEKIDEYGKGGINLTREDAERELAAEYTKEILSTPEEAMEFVRRLDEAEANGSIPQGSKRNIIQSVIDAIKRAIAKIKSMFKNPIQAEKDLQATKELFENMLKEKAAGNAAETGEGAQFNQNNTLDNSDMQVYNENGRSETEGETTAAARKIIETVDYSERYGRLSKEQRALYDSSKRGNEQAGYALISELLPKSNILDHLDKDVYLLPVIGEEGTSDNATPRAIAEHISELTGNPVMRDIYKQGEVISKVDGKNKDGSVGKKVWQRMKENYPSFNISDDIEHNDIRGKRFLLIDDNSTTGRTFRGLEKLILENGGDIAGYYAMTVGQDASEKQIVTPETWKDLEREGIEKIRAFAKKEGIKREISRTGLAEREAQELFKQYKDAYKRGGNGSLSQNGRVRTEIQNIHEKNGSAESTAEQNRIANNKSDADNVSDFFANKNNEGQFLYAGENAKNANIARLDEAKELEKQGKDREEIWRSTGWSKGQEGRWKFEIDDSKAHFTAREITGTHKLSDILEHDALYAAYPDIKNVKVAVTGNVDKNGTYSPELDAIFLDKNASPEKMRKTLLHEVQHAVQEREGFAVGANSTDPNYRNTAGEIEARDVAARADMTTEERQANFPESMKPRDDVVFADEGVSYSADKSFGEQVHDVLEGKSTQNTQVYIGETTSILKQLGFNDKPMLITEGHVKDMHHKKVPGVSKYHGLSEETIKQMPYILDYPAIAFDSISRDNPNAVCLLSEIQDDDGLPLMVVIKPDGEGKYNHIRIESNFVLTMFGKNGAQSFLDRIGENIDNVLFMDYKRTQAMLRGGGLQLPNSFSKLKFNTIIHKSHNVVNTENNGNIENNNQSSNMKEQFGLKKPVVKDIDTEYLEAVKNGDMEKAARMVRAQAEKKGYTTNADWRMNHTAPSAEYDIPITNLTELYPENIYSDNAAKLYRTGVGLEADQKAIEILRSVKDNPDKTVTVYRAVPNDVKDTRLRNGDWVTLTEEYAREHGNHSLDNDYRIIKNDVPARYLYTDANSIQELGYDNGREEAYQNTENNAKSLDTVTYDDDGSIIPLSKRFDPNNPDIRFSLSDKVNEYGAIPKGERPVRDVEVPKKISKDKFVSRFARTAMEAGVTSDEAISEFEKEILDGTMTHEAISDKNAMENAETLIKNKGFKAALDAWDVLIERGKALSKHDIALGLQLYNQCINNKDVTNAMKIAADLSVEATRSGQSLQAVRMLKKMSPDGKLYYLERSIKAINREYKNKLGDSYKDVRLNEDLMKEFLEADSDEARDEVYDKICQDIADQIPSTGVDKWNAWRYLAMLGNPRTHIRNIVGNAVFYPAVRIKSYMNAGLEKVFISKENRTSSFHKTKESKAYAAKDALLVKKELQGINAKYAVTDDIESKRRIFKVGALEFLRKKNGDFLEAEDWWFLKAHYVDAFARVMTARGITAEQLDGDTKESKTLLNKIRKIAIREAQEATYRDANSVATALNKMQRSAEKSEKRSVRAVGVAIEAVMPFKKTPLNIAKRGIEYSPIGLLNGIYNTTWGVHKGKVTASEAINKISKGFVGTALMIMGYLLADMGLLTGAGDENKKKSEYDGLVGKQNYALNIAGKSYTIDWMAPISMPLFIGVELQKATKEKEWTFAKVVNAMSTISEPLLELSCLSSLQGFIQSVQYSENNTAFAIITELATSYLTQGLPTFGGQLARMIDRKKRNAYYRDKDSQTPIFIQQFIGQVAAKVPRASRMLEPKIDRWGREEDYGELAERMIENSISPGYYSEERYTKVDKELERLNKSVGGNDMFPIGVQKYIKIDGVTYNLNVHQYTHFARLRGQKSFELVEDLMNNKLKRKKQGSKKAVTVVYSNLSDEDKVKQINKCYDDALEYAKEEIKPMLEKNEKKVKKKYEAWFTEKVE